MQKASLEVEDAVTLKSDQNGIEMVFRACLCLVPGWLKSDQNGIEMRHGGKLVENTKKVKIRPKWD